MNIEGGKWSTNKEAKKVYNYISNEFTHRTNWWLDSRDVMSVGRLDRAEKRSVRSSYEDPRESR
jgi:hypothetical protein